MYFLTFLTFHNPGPTSVPDKQFHAPRFDPLSIFRCSAPRSFDISIPLLKECLRLGCEYIRLVKHDEVKGTVYANEPLVR